MQFGDEALSLRRLEATVDAARDCGFAAVSVNDHFVFQTPWLDGPTALASVIGRSGEMELATTIALAALRALLTGTEFAPGPYRPGGIPLWIASWGSSAGLARVARAGDGWLASAYNTTPERFSEARVGLRGALEACRREPDGFPNALATMWTWVSKDRAEGDRVLAEVLAPVLKRNADELRGQVCVG